MRNFCRCVLPAAVVCIASFSWADLIGTSVTGSMTINGLGSTNFFSTSAGYVPAGCGNSGGSTTLIIGSGTEFCFQDVSNSYSANFDGTRLYIRDESYGKGSRQITFTFTDPAFLWIAELTDDFPNGISGGLSGDTVTLVVSSFDPVPSGTFDATFAVGSAPVAPVPEPGSMLLLGSGALGLFGVIRRKLRG